MPGTQFRHRRLPARLTLSEWQVLSSLPRTTPARGGGRRVAVGRRRVRVRPGVRPSAPALPRRPAGRRRHRLAASARARLSRLQEIAAHRSTAHAREGATVSDSARRR